MNKKIEALFLFPNDHSDKNRELETLELEEKEIRAAFDEVRNLDKCNFTVIKSPNRANVLTEIKRKRNQINIFHFSGHAGENHLDLMKETSEDIETTVSNQLLRIFLQGQKRNLKLVYLNGCNTLNLGNSLIKCGVDTVIATTVKVGEDDAQYISSLFYESLCTGASIKESFNEALAQAAEDGNSLNRLKEQWKLLSISDEHLAWVPFPEKEIMSKNEKMTFLQFSNLNYSPLNNTHIEDSIKNATNELKKMDVVADVIVCTGSILAKETDVSEDNFLEVANILATGIGIEEDKIVFSYGGNDRNSKAIASIFPQKILELDNNDELDSFVKNDTNIKQSCAGKEALIKFIKVMSSNNDKNITNELFTVNTISIGSKKVGIVNLDLLWCFDEGSEKAFPIDFLEKACEEVRGTDVKVVILNSIPQMLTHYNKADFEDTIFTEFDIVLGGDTNLKIEHLLETEGIFSAFISNSNTTHPNFYIHSINSCGESETVFANHIPLGEGWGYETTDIKRFKIPKGKIKKEQIKLLRRLREAKEHYIQSGNDLFVNYKTKSANFLKTFTTPIIKSQSNQGQQIFIREKVVYPNQFNNIYTNINNNYIVYGKDKSGKSSLLYHYGIRYVNDFHQNGVIPIYIDLNDIAKRLEQSRRGEFVLYVSRKLGFSKGEVRRKLFGNYKVRFLIDNFDPIQFDLSSHLGEVIEEFPNVSFVICTSLTNIITNVEKVDYHIGEYINLYIHDVTRKEVRALAHKTLDNSHEDKVNDIVEQILKVFKQHNMPFNFWTISVFLWVIAKRGGEDFVFQNNSELIELYIQELIGQKALAYRTSTTKFNYKTYKIFLAFLAQRLYERHEEDVYSASYQELLKITQEFIDQSRRRVAKAQDVVDDLMKKGILKRKSMEYYTFRLNGVFEYFLANAFRNDKNFLQSILDDTSKYLLFSNELDLYTSFDHFSSNEKSLLLEELFKKAKIGFSKHINGDASKMDLDQLFEKPVNEESLPPLHFTEQELKAIQPMNYEEQDELIDAIDSIPGNDDLPSGINMNGDVKLKDIKIETINKLEILEKHFFILGRAFRNLQIEDGNQDLEDEILDFLISSACVFGMLVIEEFNQDDLGGNEEQLHKKFSEKLLQLIKSFFPMMVQEFMYRTIGHVTMETILKEKIEAIEQSGKDDELRLFLLKFMLIDVNPKKMINQVDKIFNKAKIKEIKFSIIFKLMFYLLFKSNNDKAFTKTLKDKIRDYQKKVYPNLNLDASMQNLEKQKRLLGKQRMNKK